MLHNIHSRDNRNAYMELSPEEPQDAEEEIVHLHSTKHSVMPKKSQLIKLNPCLVENGVIRCEGQTSFHTTLDFQSFCLTDKESHLCRFK